MNPMQGGETEQSKDGAPKNNRASDGLGFHPYRMPSLRNSLRMEVRRSMSVRYGAAPAVSRFLILRGVHCSNQIPKPPGPRRTFSRCSELLRQPPVHLADSTLVVQQFQGLLS